LHLRWLRVHDGAGLSRRVLMDRPGFSRGNRDLLELRQASDRGARREEQKSVLDMIDQRNLVIPGHPLWDSFVQVLGGPDACNCRRKNGKTLWTCKGGRDKTFATMILTKMGVQGEYLKATLDYFEKHGGYCDCEILFNVDGEFRQRA
jgi:hypothetical protein